MRTPHPILLALITAGSLLLQPTIAPSVSAAGSHRISEPISFTQYSGVEPPGWNQALHPTEWWCSDLQNVTIQGTGTSSVVTNEQTRPDGSTYTEMNSTVNGTATAIDTVTGLVVGTYRFNYHNHTSTDTPAGGFPVQTMTTDGFNLVGNGGANQLHTHFVQIVTLPGPGQDPVVDWINIHGTPFNCDPI